MKYKCPKCKWTPEQGEPAFQRTTEEIVSRWYTMDTEGRRVTDIEGRAVTEQHETYETVNLLLCLNCDFEGSSTEFEESEEEEEN